MYRTKTNVFVHRTLLVLFFPSLFCQKTGFLIATDCCDSENKYITYFKNSQEVALNHVKSNRKKSWKSRQNLTQIECPKIKTEGKKHGVNDAGKEKTYSWNGKKILCSQEKGKGNDSRCFYFPDRLQQKICNLCFRQNSGVEDSKLQQSPEKMRKSEETENSSSL